MSAEPSALLFDLDGTLLDTPRAIAEQFSAAVETVTGTNPGIEAARRLIGAPLESMAGALSGSEPDSVVAAAVAAEYLVRYRELIVPKAADLLFPGVSAGLARFTAAGLVPAVVTSKKHHSAELILEAAGIRDHFAVVIGADDVANPKPHRDSADAALAGAGLTGIGPAGAVIGDTSGDIGLGRAIGAFTIGVGFGVYSTEQITATNPDLVAHTFDDVTHAVLRRIASLPTDRK
ncbi:HAD family hydrolase [Nocardia carnea]|uniref:HAD family hydrolase n=1 Tax=Nocardia carnea TaxID=37328 RepID=UPI002458E231|nr:HAD family hydrolase [Nocardia carnea]